MRPLLTTGVIAKRLGLNIKTVRRWCREGIIPGALQAGTGKGSVWFVQREAFDAWFAAWKGRNTPRKTA